MEIVIVICLLIVIALLLQDKIVIKNRLRQESPQKKFNPNLPDIIGQPKPIERISAPNTANERQIEEPDINPANLEIEYDENENVSVQIPEEELDEVFRNMPDLEEEEEEWNSYGISGGDNVFAQGVNFEELSSVGVLLQKEELEPAQKETAIAIVQKIQGTELFSLLENSVEDASRRIAELLDSRLSSETENSSSTLRKSDLSDFDIEEFV